MFFRLLMGQALRANTDETPPAEILRQVIARMPLASELKRISQVLGPLIADIETFPEEVMHSLEILDQQIVVHETGITV
jgi:hypothetical protein